MSSGARRLSCRPIGHLVMSPAAQNVESGSPFWSMWLTPNNQPRLCGSSVGHSAASGCLRTHPGVPGPLTVSPEISSRTAAAGASIPPSLTVTYRTSQVSAFGVTVMSPSPAGMLYGASVTSVAQSPGGTYTRVTIPVSGSVPWLKTWPSMTNESPRPQIAYWPSAQVPEAQDRRAAMSTGLPATSPSGPGSGIVIEPPAQSGSRPTLTPAAGPLMAYWTNWLLT